MKKSKSLKKVKQLIMRDQILSSGHVLKFQIGEIVYLKMDTDQTPRMVIGIHLLPEESVSYSLTDGDGESNHTAMEISREECKLKKLLDNGR